MGVVGLVELAESIELLALDNVHDRDLSDELIELYQQRSRLDAQISRRVRAFDTRGDCVHGGHRTTASWLMDHCRRRPFDAYRDVRVARATDQLDLVRDAWVSGRTTTEHVHVVEAARHSARDNDAFAEFEPALTDVCESSTVDDTIAVLARWRDALDAHRQTDDDLKKKIIERRRLKLSPVGDQGVINGACDLGDFAIIKEAIEIELQRGHVEGDERTPAQQRLDALVAICKRVLDRRDPAGSNRPHIIIGTDPQTVAGLAVGRTQTSTGITLPMSTIQRLACDAFLCRVILDTDSQNIDLGRAVRTFTFEQRKAMFIRDGGCTFPGCSRPAADCEAHHFPPWEQGGLTNMRDGTLACWAHHRLVHELGWTITRNTDNSRRLAQTRRHLPRPLETATPTRTHLVVAGVHTRSWCRRPIRARTECSYTRSSSSMRMALPRRIL